MQVHVKHVRSLSERQAWIHKAALGDTDGEGSRQAIEPRIHQGRIEHPLGVQPMKRYMVEGLADVGAVLFELVERYEKTGFAEVRMIPKDLKTARTIVDGYLNYVRGRHKRRNVIIDRLSLVFEKGRGDQIGSFVLGMGKPTAKPAKTRKPSPR